MLTNIKKRSALLVTLAVVCATVALVPQGAAAQSKVPNTGVGADVYTAPTALSYMSACPGASAAAAGFTDTTSTDVDCIKMYGITQGTTATTYEPDGTIPRWQMALFIHRMFVPTGVAAAGLTAVPAFTDTSGLSAEIQAAITALASHGITLGTSATTFGPNDNVTREQMALFLNRFAGIAKQADGSAMTTNIASGSYNYSDLSSATFEGLEAIARLYNLGVTEGACVGGIQYVTAGTCSTTYRPNDAITRAEMASMITRLLGHSNARPAGVSIQPTTSTAALGSEATLISVRNADFTPSISTLVDEFYQVHNDATGVAAQAPFHAVLGTCTAANVSAANNTLCTMANNDKITGALGNVAGTAQTTAANTTANWWVWTGDSGAAYVDGTTAGVFKLSLVNGAAAAATTYGDTTTYTSNKTTATLTSAAGMTGVTANDGTSVIAGGSITFTATMSNSTLTSAGTAHTVVDGYTFKFADHKVDHLGNVTNSITYVPSSGGAASYTVTCDADDSALNTNYMVSHEITVSMAAADGGTGIPAGASPGNPIANQTGRMNNSTLNVTCDDAARAYDGAGGAGTVETLTVSANNYVVATAGSLASMTATAYDKYGDGMAGVTVQFQKGGADQSVLTTGAGGSATLTTVVCTANGEEAWSVNTNNGVMDTIAATTPNATIEGTTIYCAQNATDTAPAVGTTAVTYSNVTGVNTVYTITASGDAASGAVTCTINGVAATAFAFDANNAAAQNALNAASTSNGATAVYAAGPPEVWTITNDGGASLPTCASTLALANSNPLTVAIAATTAGTVATTMDFIDNDAASNSFIAKMTEKNHGVTRTLFIKFTYDDTDYFRTAANPALTEAAFEAALGAVANLTTDMSIAWRTGALTNGISAIALG